LKKKHQLEIFTNYQQFQAIQKEEEKTFESLNRPEIYTKVEFTFCLGWKNRFKSNLRP
jgi:hypothetical protein